MLDAFEFHFSVQKNSEQARVCSCMCKILHFCHIHTKMSSLPSGFMTTTDRAVCVNRKLGAKKWTAIPTICNKNCKQFSSDITTFSIWIKYFVPFCLMCAYTHKKCRHFIRQTLLNLKMALLYASHKTALWKKPVQEEDPPWFSFSRLWWSVRAASVWCPASHLWRAVCRGATLPQPEELWGQKNSQFKYLQDFVPTVSLSPSAFIMNDTG